MSAQPTAGSILDAIFEKTANLESSNNITVINRFITESLRAQARRERNTRESTVTFKMSENFGKTEITQAIEEWINKNEQLPPTIWQDKDYTYCQMDAKDTCEALISFIKKANNNELKQALIAPNKQGLHFTRKPVV